MPRDMRIPMVFRVAGSLDEFVHHDLRSGAVGIAHSEIDDVHTCCACLCLHFIDDGEYIGGQLLYAVEIVWS